MFDILAEFIKMYEIFVNLEQKILDTQNIDER